MSDNKVINPTEAYTLNEAAGLLKIHPMTLRRKLPKKNEDTLLKTLNPVQVYGEWRFLGENLLRALGSASYSQAQNVSQDNSGAANPSMDNKGTESQ